MKDDDCVALLQWALPRLGLLWPGFRKVRRQICKRISRRMAALGQVDVNAYRAFVDSDSDEWDALAALCTVSISRFYRDREVFDCLGSAVLPALAEAAIGRGDQCLECWSAGCACGEEPYTLVIQWQCELAPRFPGLELRVLATDADERVLDRARLACYAASSLASMPATWRALAFERREERYCLRDAYRGSVELERQDPRAVMPPRQFDLVLCRNLVFTYFAPELVVRTLDAIASRLRTGGALVVGLHERLPGAGGRFAPWPGCRAILRSLGVALGGPDQPEAASSRGCVRG